MEAIKVMKRYELKYLMDRKQTAALRKALKGHMQIDAYGLTTIASLYYDTPDARLVRASLEKPEYKEKLRLRSYGLATESSPVYLELKRKAEGIVYKRRIEATLPQVRAFMAGGDALAGDAQIRKELAYFRDYYQNLEPACLVLYDRRAYCEREGDLRLTIDERPRYRMEDLSLTHSLEGIPLLGEGWCILEIKVQGAMPLWLSSALGQAEIYKTSFSKYGEAFQREALKENNSLIMTAPKIIGAA